jgi:hypothetical protein
MIKLPDFEIEITEEAYEDISRALIGPQPVTVQVSLLRLQRVQNRHVLTCRLVSKPEHVPDSSQGPQF